MKSPTLHAVLWLPLLLPGVGLGQAIYKSIDSEGNVTYSGTAPPTAAAIEPVIIRSDARRDERLKAQRLREDVERQAAEERNRREQDKARRAEAVADAEQRLNAARQRLEAVLRRGDDRGHSPERGMALPSQAHRDLVEREERRVREAERAVREAKAGKLPQETKASSAASGPRTERQ
jgi:hypothetical protein